LIPWFSGIPRWIVQDALLGGKTAETGVRRMIEIRIHKNDLQKVLFNDLTSIV